MADAADLKSAEATHVGSTPTSPTKPACWQELVRAASNKHTTPNNFGGGLGDGVGVEAVEFVEEGLSALADELIWEADLSDLQVFDICACQKFQYRTSEAALFGVFLYHYEPAAAAGHADDYFGIERFDEPGVYERRRDSRFPKNFGRFHRGMNH